MSTSSLPRQQVLERPTTNQTSGFAPNVLGQRPPTTSSLTTSITKTKNKHFPPYHPTQQLYMDAKIKRSNTPTPTNVERTFIPTFISCSCLRFLPPVLAFSTCMSQKKKKGEENRGRDNKKQPFRTDVHVPSAKEQPFTTDVHVPSGKRVVSSGKRGTLWYTGH